VTDEVRTQSPIIEEVLQSTFLWHSIFQVAMKWHWIW